MVAFLIAVLSLVTILVALYFTTPVKSRKSGHWIFQKVFGLHVGVGRWFGNCFSPAVVFVWNGFPVVRTMERLIASLDEARLTLMAENSSINQARVRMYEKALTNFQEGKRLPQAAFATLTIRTGYSHETVIYFRRWSISWNSEHVARWFGTWHEAPHGDVAYYRGILGHHSLV